MKIKSILIIMAGILIASYPAILHSYTLHRQETLLQEWDQMVKNQNQKVNSDSDSSSEPVSSDAAESFLVLEDTFSQAQENGKNDAYEHETPSQLSAKSKKTEINTLGVLYIDKIDLELPVMDGSTPDILRLGAGRLKGTSDIGEIGNTAISAHRSHKYGLNFNRLNEVEEGDRVRIDTINDSFTYEVFNIQVVEPGDTSVLKKSKTDSILTLITCHPLYIASHRLIVQARLLPDQ